MYITKSWAANAIMEMSIEVDESGDDKTSMEVKNIDKPFL